ncbi:conserved hypothetical protein, partial [Ricinus communis]
MDSATSKEILRGTRKSAKVTALTKKLDGHAEDKMLVDRIVDEKTEDVAEPIKNVGANDGLILFWEKPFNITIKSYSLGHIDAVVLESVSVSVNTAMNNQLISPFVADEIKTALFDMHPYKALGLVGFHALFYQKFWSIVGENITRECLEFLNSGVRREERNKTLITLVPKVQQPQHVKEFRPIILVHDCANLKNYLKPYELASGQTVNYEKSTLSFSPNCKDAIITAMKDLFVVLVVHGHQSAYVQNFGEVVVSQEIRCTGSLGIFYRSLLEGKELVNLRLWWRISDGASTYVYEDKWLPIPLSLMCDGGWNAAMVQNHFHPHEAAVILAIPRPRFLVPDSPCWHFKKIRISFEASSSTGGSISGCFRYLPRGMLGSKKFTDPLQQLGFI